jgi:hypothetical protein
MWSNSQGRRSPDAVWSPRRTPPPARRGHSSVDARRTQRRTVRRTADDSADTTPCILRFAPTMLDPYLPEHAAELAEPQAPSAPPGSHPGSDVVPGSAPSVPHNQAVSEHHQVPADKLGTQLVPRLGYPTTCPSQSRATEPVTWRRPFRLAWTTEQYRSHAADNAYRVAWDYLQQAGVCRQAARSAGAGRWFAAQPRKILAKDVAQLLHIRFQALEGIKPAWWPR